MSTFRAEENETRVEGGKELMRVEEEVEEESSDVQRTCGVVGEAQTGDSCDTDSTSFKSATSNRGDKRESVGKGSYSEDAGAGQRTPSEADEKKSKSEKAEDDTSERGGEAQGGPGPKWTQKTDTRTGVPYWEDHNGNRQPVQGTHTVTFNGSSGGRFTQSVRGRISMAPGSKGNSIGGFP